MGLVASGRRVRVVGALALALAGLTLDQGHAYQRPGNTHLVSLSFNGGDLTDSRDRPYTTAPVITSDGRFVAFQSAAQDLVPESENPQGTLAKVQAVTAVFVHDELTGKNTVVTVRSDGRPVLCPLGLGSCPLGGHPAISDDGRYVAFESASPNLVDLDTNLSTDVFVRDVKLKTTTRVSVGTGGTEGNQASSWPSISADGRYVAFESSASNLVPGDTNGNSDVFVRDLKTGTTTRVSVDSGGNQAGSSTPLVPLASNAASVIPEISKTGRYVAFLSFASNLVPSDTNNRDDVFIRDLTAKTTSLVSVATDGTQTDGNSGGRLGVSADGRYVSFVSLAKNLVPNDTNDDDDVFVRDRLRNRTTRVSLTSIGHEAQRPLNPVLPLLMTGVPAYDSSMSWSGRFVEFWSIGTDFGATGSPVPAASQNIFVYDTATGAVTMASVSSTGKAPVDDGPCTTGAGQPCAYSGTGALSGSGRWVAFASSATNLDSRHSRSSATPDTSRIYRRDLGAPVLAGVLANVAVPQSAASATRLALGAPSAVLAGASLVYRPGTHDLFGRIELADLDLASPTSWTTVYGMNLSVRGLHYQVRVQRLPPSVSGKVPGAPQAATFSLFREGLDGSWQHLSDLQGGFGTSGAEVVFAVPLGALGAPTTTQVGALDVFTGAGTLGTGLVAPLDRLVLGG
jgi:hypothetical protein